MMLGVDLQSRCDYGNATLQSNLFDPPDLATDVGRMVFARIHGSMEWCCPYCGHLNRSTLHYKMFWRVQCNGSDCRRTMAIGLLFYPMAAGFKVPPPDSIMPIEISRELYRKYQPVNRLVTTRGD